MFHLFDGFMRIVLLLITLCIPNGWTFTVQGGSGYVIFDGDMLMTPMRASEIYFRSGRAQKEYLWPNGVVNFIIDRGFTSEQVQKIRDVMKTIQKNTCIKFSETHAGSGVKYVKFETGNTGCWSFVGYQNIQEQVLNFNEKCFSKIGVIFHEILHSIGLFHMQNDNSRDDYVRIAWDNIKDNMKQNFVKYDTTVSSSYGVPYDYGSVMHYSKKAFSKNGQDTIVALKASNEEMGQRLGPTEKDYLRVRNMYECQKRVKRQVMPLKEVANNTDSSNNQTDPSISKERAPEEKINQGGLQQKNPQTETKGKTTEKGAPEEKSRQGEQSEKTKERESDETAKQAGLEEKREQTKQNKSEEIEANTSDETNEGMYAEDPEQNGAEEQINQSESGEITDEKRESEEKIMESLSEDQTKKNKSEEKEINMSDRRTERTEPEGDPKENLVEKQTNQSKSGKTSDEKSEEKIMQSKPEEQKQNEQEEKINQSESDETTGSLEPDEGTNESEEVKQLEDEINQMEWQPEWESRQRKLNRKQERRLQRKIKQAKLKLKKQEKRKKKQEERMRKQQERQRKRQERQRKKQEKWKKKQQERQRRKQEKRIRNEKRKQEMRNKRRQQQRTTNQWEAEFWDNQRRLEERKYLTNPKPPRLNRGNLGYHYLDYQDPEYDYWMNYFI